MHGNFSKLESLECPMKTRLTLYLYDIWVLICTGPLGLPFALARRSTSLQQITHALGDPFDFKGCDFLKTPRGP